MKKIIAYIFAGAVLVFAASCSREPIGQAAEGDAFALQVYCSELTKAGTTPGEGNENKVVSLDYFFFADTVSSAAVFHYRDAAPTATAGKYQGIFTPGTTYGGNEFPTREALYGTNDHTTVFIVANLPEAKVPAALPTWETLKGIAVEQSFMADGAALPTDSSDMEFVMTAQAEVKGNITGVFTQVGLERLAAKMSFDIKVAESVSLTGTLDGDGGTYTETWTPMLSGNNARFSFQQAFLNTVLGAADGVHYPTSVTQASYTEFVPTWSDNKTSVGPYYSAAASWKDNQSQAPFAKIIVPWQVVRKDSDGKVFYSAQREVYYKVMLPGTEILANNYYQFTVDITVVGTETDPEVVIDATYQVADWTSGGAGKVNGQISDIKYLTVDRKQENEDGIIDVYVNNAQVQYSASETAVIDWTVSSIYYLDFITSGLTDHKRYIIENGELNSDNGKGITDVDAAKAWVTLTEMENPNSETPDTYITLNHELINVLTEDNFDATPYFYDITIRLSTGGAEPKTVHFKQYPQSYIEEEPNSGDDPHTVWYDAGTNWNHNWVQRSLGYVYVNGQHEDATDGSYGGVNGLTGGNQNGNMYVVTTSVLSDAQKVIGDPRIAKGTYDNITATNWNPARTSAPVVSGGSNRVLTYYKRTEGGNNNNTRTRYMIAPSFRIASSYGVTSSLSYDNASRRCASYQEDGYPAGRWRLPTAAEIEYCVTLSAKGRLPRLFGEAGRSTDYWSANGYITVNGNNVTPHINSFTNDRYVRCVYDDWYWGHDRVSAAQHTFMWGDEEDK